MNVCEYMFLALWENILRKIKKITIVAAFP